MSILAKYTKAELKQISKIEFMRDATFEDMINDLGKVFNVAYLARESTKHVDQIKALEVQVQQLEGFISQHNHFRLASNCKFVESGKSGLSIEWRETFQLMIEMAGKHIFDVLIVDSVSRFARNIGEVFSTIDTLKELGVGILVLTGGYWLYNMTPNDVLRLAVEAGMAQAESMQTSTRVRSHMHTIAANGQLFGGDMFGYRLAKAVERRNNTLEIEKTEAYTVQTIFEKYASDDPEEHLSTSGLVSYLIEKKMPTFTGDLNWTPSKINRIICNEKYMGYEMYGKSKVVDTIKKKKVLTKMKPKADVCDENGKIIEKGNLVKGNWIPIVSPELWWKANHKLHSSGGAKWRDKAKFGIRASGSAIARKSYCACGYTMTPQYTHAASNEKGAQYRYKCRWQINNEIIRRSGLLQEVICNREAVSEMKMWLQSKYVFDYLFASGKEAVQKTIRLIEQCKRDEELLGKDNTLDSLKQEVEKRNKRLANYIEMRADGEISAEEYKVMYRKATEEKEELEEKISRYETESIKRQKKMLDLEGIEKRLNSYVDLSGVKVSDDMIEMFVERIICRGNDEFLWEINLSEDATGSGQKYHILSYDPERAKGLTDDSQFNIVTKFIIPVDECEDYCKNVVHRRFVPKYWKNIIVKIAIC